MSAALDKQRSNLQNRIRKLKKEKETLMTQVADANEKMKKTQESRQAVEDAFVRMREMGTDENKGYEVASEW